MSTSLSLYPRALLPLPPTPPLASQMAMDSSKEEAAAAGQHEAGAKAAKSSGAAGGGGGKRMSKAERRKAKRRSERAGDSDNEDAEEHPSGSTHGCAATSDAGRGNTVGEQQACGEQDGSKGGRGGGELVGKGQEVEMPVEVDLAELCVAAGGGAEDVESDDDVAGCTHALTHACALALTHIDAGTHKQAPTHILPCVRACVRAHMKELVWGMLTWQLGCRASAAKRGGYRLGSRPCGGRRGRWTACCQTCYGV
jgi:hypothetical protein